VLVETLAKPLFQKQDLSHVPMKYAATALKDYSNSTSSTVRADKDALSFYFLNHAMSWFRTSRHEQKPYTHNDQEFVDTYMKLVTDITARAYNYLLIICTREARHGKSGMVSGGNIFDYLTTKYSLEVSTFLKQNTNKNGSSSVEHLIQSDLDVPMGVYTDALTDMFNQGSWSGGYGGKKWGIVAKCLRDFVHGHLSPEMMTDTIWTLSHNNGPIFNKPYLYSGYTHDLISVLDVQRSGQIPQLIWDYHYGLKYMHSELQAMPELYNKVCKLLGNPDELSGYVDWWKVEMLGAVKSYSSYKYTQKEVYGESIYSKKATILEKQVKMKMLKEKQDELAQWYSIGPTQKLKKLTRGELHG